MKSGQDGERSFWAEETTRTQIGRQQKQITFEKYEVIHTSSFPKAAEWWCVGCFGDGQWEEKEISAKNDYNSSGEKWIWIHIKVKTMGNGKKG